MKTHTGGIGRQVGSSRGAWRLPTLVAIGLLAIVGLDASPCHAQAKIEAEAFSGAPFGVGRITIQSGGEIRFKGLPRPGAARGGRIADLAKRIIDPSGKNPGVNLESTEMALTEKTSRVFYPVFEKRDRPLLREFVSVPTQATIYFLFQGDAPLDVTVYAPQPTAGQVTPVRNPAAHAQLLRAWWNDYSAAAEERGGSKEYPPLVEEYLVNTLARRLQLPLTDREPTRKSSLLQSELSLLAGTESARMEMARAILQGDVPHGLATESLAEELPRPKPELLNPPGDTPIEAMAMHVPVECLYMRFGSFLNFLWLRKRMDEWGGELRDVMSERGLDYGLNERWQRQLGLKESGLAELFGDKVIADVALIGTDMFVNEGAAMGTLFHAKNSAALAADLTQQRLTALKATKGGQQQSLKIGNRQVSFFATPDNSLRSFYVADGDFHLVTTSRAMVERFLATGAGKHESLGASNEFRLARASLPLTRNDTVFIYLSPEFFRNLMSPQYQIELDRRLRSAVEIELFGVARLAARGEQKAGDTIDELVHSGLLPTGFGEHPDGSRLEIVAGDMVDSVRGRLGTFVPVPDVELGKTTPGEIDKYRQLADTYTKQWGAMDPVVAGIQRQTVTDGLERVVLDVRAAPLSPQHSQMLAQWLGPPSDQRLAPIPGDVAAFEAVVRGGTFFSGGEHHLFGGLRDADPAMASDPRTSLMARLLASQLAGLNGYLGAWPNPGFLRMLGGESNIPADAAGYSQLRTGLWRRQFDDFTLLSLQGDVLPRVSPQLKFIKAERPAQVWFRADDLSKSQLALVLNAYGYRQSRQITQGNTRFMNMLAEQLHVPQADARTTAEQVLHARLMAPLGGDYELREFPGGLKAWVSQALADQPNPDQPPKDYQFPALDWFRGIELDMHVDNGLLALHAEAIMPAETKPAGGFQFPGLSFGGSKASAPQAKPKPAPSQKTPQTVRPKSPTAKEF